MVMKLLLLAFAAAVLSSSVVSAQAPFQFYKLSLIWPASFCLTQNCFNPIPRIFTIHGFWPSFGNDNAVPPYDPYYNNCFNNPSPKSPAQAMTEVTQTPILRDLNIKWPNLFGPRYNPSFWQTEWSRHGMCSDYGADPFWYFATALSHADDPKYDPFKAMGVQPSNTPHQIGTLLANVKTNLGFYPQISCLRVGQQLYLKEFRLCFVRVPGTQPVQLQDCPYRTDGACGPFQNRVLIPN